MGDDAGQKQRTRKKWALGALVAGILVLILALSSGGEDTVLPKTNVGGGGNGPRPNVDDREVEVFVKNPPAVVDELNLEEEMFVPPPPPKIKVSDDRLLAHVSTDKPYYQPGETVFVEVHLIDAITKKPAQANSTQA
jgi:hypothetical protein